MRYVLYEDHVGWVLTSAAVYDEIGLVHRALLATTWGEFMALLPSSTREQLLRAHCDMFGSGFGNVAGEAEPEADSHRIVAASTFDPSQVPGFDEGSFPVWPANDATVTDAICRLAYERYGQRQDGYVQTFHHVEKERIPELCEWLRTQGHDLELRRRPGADRASY
jgi:hypothetical protein